VIECGGCGLTIIERRPDALDFLRCFMALTGNHDHVARFGPIDDVFDGAPAIQFDVGVLRSAHAGAYLISYELRILTTRIVIGYDNVVGQFFGNDAHLRPLLRIPIATTPEDDMHLTVTLLRSMSGDGKDVL